MYLTTCIKYSLEIVLKYQNVLKYFFKYTIYKVYILYYM